MVSGGGGGGGAASAADVEPHEDLQKRLNNALLLYCLITFFVQFIYAAILWVIRHRRSDKQGVGKTRLRRWLQLHRTEDGVFSLQELGLNTNVYVNAFNFCFFLGPQLLIFTVVIFGYLLAIAEGWETPSGPDFLTYAAGLQINQIGNEAIKTRHGEIFGVVLAVKSYMMVNTVLGLTGLMGFVKKIDSLLPTTTAAFVFLVLSIIAPFSIAAFCCLMSVPEYFLSKAAFSACFQGMLDWVSTGGNLGLVPPPKLEVGHLFMRIMTALYAVTFSGVLLGLVGAHRVCQDLMEFLEGDWDGELELIGELGNGQNPMGELSKEALEIQRATEHREHQFVEEARTLGNGIGQHHSRINHSAQDAQKQTQMLQEEGEIVIQTQEEEVTLEHVEVEVSEPLPEISEPLPILEGSEGHAQQLRPTHSPHLVDDYVQQTAIMDDQRLAAMKLRVQESEDMDALKQGLAAMKLRVQESEDRASLLETENKGLQALVGKHRLEKAKELAREAKTRSKSQVLGGTLEADEALPEKVDVDKASNEEDVDVHSAHQAMSTHVAHSLYAHDPHLPDYVQQAMHHARECEIRMHQAELQVQFLKLEVQKMQHLEHRLKEEVCLKHSLLSQLNESATMLEDLRRALQQPESSSRLFRACS